MLAHASADMHQAPGFGSRFRGGDTSSDIATVRVVGRLDCIGSLADTLVSAGAREH
jgi:hypothetical protein